jgi:hypothetical protein
LKKIFINLIMVAVSILFSAVICEMAARIFLKPVDYLSVITANDPILGHKILPFASGHDAWGFRNPGIPVNATIVTLGDSHTYGNAAKMNESWPFVLERLTANKVYNLGMGGYGPNQYYSLFQSKALLLKPKTIICGLFMGDDLDNAYCITYGLDYWKAFRDTTMAKSTEGCVWEMNTGSSWNAKARHWLSSHCVLYQVIVHGPVLGWLKGMVQIKRAEKPNGSTAVLNMKSKNIFEAFCLVNSLRGLDISRATTKEGLRITLALMHAMNDTCVQRGIRFLVVIIPSKETVFSPYIEHNEALNLHEIIDRGIEGERIARQQITDFFNRSAIEYVDVLPSLQEGITKGRLYNSSSEDMHPNKNGYRIIAECVARHMDSTSSVSPASISGASGAIK